MANGDTKTNQYLDVAANGTRADLPTDTCCETRTQTLIRGVANRIMDLEDEVERLENNPDVVDIVATYADLQTYDTSGLTDKDIIRVLEDETHDDNSTYYRWDAATSQFEFVGEIAGGDTITELTTADYNYPAANPTSVALWLLSPGVYTRATNTVAVRWGIGSDQLVANNENIFIKAQTDSGSSRTLVYGNNAVVHLYLSNSSGNEGEGRVLLIDSNVAQTTGTFTTNVMSQNATTSMVYADPNGKTRVQIGNAASATGVNAVALGRNTIVAQANAAAIGYGSTTMALGEVSFGGPNLGNSGYNNSQYRLLTNVYDPQSAHDAATKGYVDGLVGDIEAALAEINSGDLSGGV